MGQRQTDSGSVSFRDVVCHPDDFLGPPGAGGSVWATLRPCVTQSILSNVFVGLAQRRAAWRRASTRSVWSVRSRGPHPSGGGPVRPGALRRNARPGGRRRAPARRAAEALQTAWEREYALTADERGACAVAVSMAKVAAGRMRAGRDQSLFEVMGARATSSKVSLRSLLAERADADAARPARLQSPRSRRLVPQRAVSNAVVLLVVFVNGNCGTRAPQASAPESPARACRASPREWHCARAPAATSYWRMSAQSAELPCARSR